MSVFEVRHQASAQLILQRAIGSSRIPHAYIFHGPEGVGKEMLALRFSKLLLCEQRREAEAAGRRPAGAPDATGTADIPMDIGLARANTPPEYAELSVGWQDSCGACQSCGLLTAGTHPDCHIVHRRLIKLHDDPEVRRRKALELGVPVIRQFVIEAAGKKSALGRGKVFILKGCDRLNDKAQNALLKTLEEPPPETYLILLWPGLAGMLATTRSRCQMVPFRPLPSQFVAEQLRRLRPGLPEEQVQYFARHEPGSLGTALRLIDDGFHECNTQLVKLVIDLKRTDSIRLAEQIQKMGEAQAKGVQQRLAESGSEESAIEPIGGSGAADETEPEEREDLTDKAAARQALQSLLAMMATVYRDILSLAVARTSTLCNGSAAVGLQHLAARLGADHARQAIRAISDAEYQLALNANTRLCLEDMTIQLARLGGR